MLPPKHHEEIVNVVFDFAKIIAKAGLPDTSLGATVVETGSELGDGKLVEGTKSVTGVKVVQQYSIGTKGQSYDVSCLATLSNGEKRRLKDVLPVT